MKLLRSVAPGFSLIELIVVMIVLSIISIFAVSRFSSRTVFDEAGFFQESLSATRYAQKMAIASGCDIRVLFTATDYTLTRWQNGASCAANGGTGVQGVSRPGGGNFTNTVPNGVSLSAAELYFDQIGRPRSVATNNLLAATTITIGSRVITVEGETGFTRCTTGC